MTRRCLSILILAVLMVVPVTEVLVHAGPLPITPNQITLPLIQSNTPFVSWQNLVALWLGQIQRWLYTTLTWAGSAAWSEWGSEWGEAPDYTYSAGTVAGELSQIAQGLPGSVQQWRQAP